MKFAMVSSEWSSKSKAFQVLSISHALPASVEIEVERVRPAWLVLRMLGGFLTQPVRAAPQAVVGS